LHLPKSQGLIDLITTRKMGHMLLLDWHQRKLIAALVKESKQSDSILGQLERKIISLENRLNDFAVYLKQDKEQRTGDVC